MLLDNFLSAPILFFALGLGARMSGSPLHIPRAPALLLSQILLIAIGIKGGLSMATHGLPANLGWLLGFGLLFSLTTPWLGAWVLRHASGLNAADAAAIATHYGSVSVVTFMAALNYFHVRQVDYSGHMVALLLVMEIPALFTGIWLAGRSLGRSRPAWWHWLHDVLANPSIVLLVGGLLIGLLARGESAGLLEQAFIAPFYGLLCLFLLDMGLQAGDSQPEWRLHGWVLPLFAIIFPLFCAVSAILCGFLLGLSAPDATLLAVLTASASYIVVPAGLRMALPNANVALGTTLALSVTFPFNIIVGIPLYFGFAQWVLGPGDFS
jgi:hypothetical protein